MCGSRGNVVGLCMPIRPQSVMALTRFRVSVLFQTAFHGCRSEDKGEFWFDDPWMALMRGIYSICTDYIQKEAGPV